MKVKEESGKVGLKLNIQKTKIMASGPITPWEIDGETVSDFIFLGSKITADGDSMSSSNCCFLTCIQVSQEVGQVVWYSHLLKNFPQFIVTHTVKGFGIVNKAEIDVFLEISCFFNDLADVGNLICGSSAFSKTSLNIWIFMAHILLKPGLENFDHYFASM